MPWMTSPSFPKPLPHQWGFFSHLNSFESDPKGDPKWLYLHFWGEVLSLYFSWDLKGRGESMNILQLYNFCQEIGSHSANALKSIIQRDPLYKRNLRGLRKKWLQKYQKEVKEAQGFKGKLSSSEKLIFLERQS